MAEIEKDKDDPSFVQEVAKKCMDAPGYVIFAGILTNERDAKGRPIIDFNYRRFQFSFDDTDTAIKTFKEHFRKDVLEMIDGVKKE